MQKPKTNERALSQAEITEKLKPFESALQMWKEDHGEHIPPPLGFDSKTQEFYWINRKDRRARGKKKKKIPAPQAPITIEANPDPSPERGVGVPDLVAGDGNSGTEVLPS